MDQTERIPFKPVGRTDLIQIEVSRSEIGREDDCVDFNKFVFYME